MNQILFFPFWTAWGDLRVFRLTFFFPPHCYWWLKTQPKKKLAHTKIETTMWNSEIHLEVHCSLQEEIKPKIYFLRQQAVYKSYKMQSHRKKKKEMKILSWFACFFSKLALALIYSKQQLQILQVDFSFPELWVAHKKPMPFHRNNYH